MHIDTRRWLLRQPDPRRRLRLFCFSYAGGSAAAFHSWQVRLDPAIEVCALQLPGRGERLGEPAIASLALMIDTLAQVTANLDDLPFAYFGHSLGALLAFELARHRQRQGARLPVRLFASGSPAPRRRVSSRRLHELSDVQLIAALRQYNGVPAAVLDEPELMALMLPTVRADFALAADYVYQSGAALAVPISVYGGEHDPHVPFHELANWQEESAAPLRGHCFPGDHFFIQTARESLLAQISGELVHLLGRAETLGNAQGSLLQGARHPVPAPAPPMRHRRCW